MVPVRCARGEVQLVPRRRRPLHSVPSAHARDGPREEGLSWRMLKSPLAHIVATDWAVSLLPLVLHLSAWVLPSGQWYNRLEEKLETTSQKQQKISLLSNTSITSDLTLLLHVFTKRNVKMSWRKKHSLPVVFSYRKKGGGGIKDGWCSNGQEKSQGFFWTESCFCCQYLTWVFFPES